MDFSWVRSKAGLLSRTSIPAASSLMRLSSFSETPLRRLGFSMMRTLTPLRWAAITASRIGWTESSGRTIKVRDIYGPWPLRSGLGRCCIELYTIQLGVGSTQRQELVVRALLCDHAAFQHDDFIRIADGAQPVRNGEHGSSFHQAFQGFDDQSFRFGVQGCRRFVENQNRVIAYDRARDADALALAAGEGISAVADQ